MTSVKARDFAKANLKEYHIEHFVKFAEKQTNNLDMQAVFTKWKTETADEIYNSICGAIEDMFNEKYATECLNNTCVEWDDKEKDFCTGCSIDGMAENKAMGVLEEFFNY
jgi:hypothetical protein